MITTELIPVLQTAIGPAILISAIGLLLLTMTNRLGRTIDRARALSTDGAEREKGHGQQLSILWQRAVALRWAILSASLSALGAGLLIIALFVSFLTRVEFGWFICSLFIASMLLLIGAIVLFIHDVNKSLEALRLEIRS